MFRDAAKRLSICLTLVGLGGWLLAPGLSVASTTLSALVCPNIFDAVTLTSGEASPTTQASLAVEGAAEPNSTVVLTVNGVQRAVVVTAIDGTYGATVPLVVGDNTIVATANDGACGDTASSSPLTMHRDQEAPDAPVIASPLSGAVTTDSAVMVQGSAEADANLSVRVNGTEVATLTVPGDGSFGVSVPLVMGSNQIQAVATNPAGTGPLSAVVTVTRQLLPSPAVVTPSPTPAPRPVTGTGASPEILRPANGTSTTAESAVVVIAGSAGARASVRVGGVEVAKLRMGAGGTAEVTVPLAVGENVITAVINGRASAPVMVRREAVVTAPVITAPADGAKTSEASVLVTGRADRDSKVRILLGNKQAAEVVADEAGEFAAKINLRPGLNLIYAEVTASDGSVVRSEAVQISREEAGPAVAAKSGLAALLAVPAAVVLLTAQGLGEVLAEVAASPLAVIMVLSLSSVVSTMGRGLLGLEILLLLPGLVRSWWIRRRGDVVRGRAVDSVTGQPLAWAKITVSGGRPVQAVSGPGGWFSLPAMATNEPMAISADRPGYRPEEEPRADLMVELEPNGSNHSPLAVAMDIAAGLVAWPVMIFGALLSFYLFAKAPGAFTLVLALVAAAVLLSNIGLLISQPRYQWGRITDAEGEPLADAEVSLTDESGREVSIYRTNRSGRYTLYAEPGQYHLRVTVDGAVRHDEPLTVYKHGTYLGFGLKLPAEGNSVSGL